MPDIQLLDPSVVSLIAAGEVVERPSSVVKELVENSIDAGATRIDVEITGGGLSMIRVSDNGCGMSPENAEKAFLKHATSKISTKEDLFCIGTMGFRGEALAAISAVSRVELVTRQTGQVSGTALSLEGGRLLSSQETGCADGAVFTVRDLFFNTPARLKFMKSEMTEAGVIQSVTERLALSHPEISFRLTVNGYERLQTPGQDNLLDTIWSLYGKDFSEMLLPVTFASPVGKVYGYVGKPIYTKPNRNRQIFFLNRRCIRSRLLSTAFENAYKNSMLVGRAPVCVLFLDIPADQADINVHPGKLEAKFTDENAVSGLIRQAAEEALRGDSGVVRMHLRSTPAPAPSLVKSAPVSVPSSAKSAPAAVSPLSTAASAPTTAPSSVKTTPAPRAANPAAASAAPSASSATRPSVHAKPSASAAPSRSAPGRIVLSDVLSPSKEAGQIALSDVLAPSAEAGRIVPDILSGAAPADADWTITPPAAPAPVAGIPVAPSVPGPETPPAAAPSEPEPALFETPEPFRIVGEVFRCYVVVERGEEVLFIDKHALHERMNFERLRTSPITSQSLLQPVLCRADVRENQVLSEHLPLLAQLGFVLEPFGDGDLLVREIPDLIGLEDALPLLEDLAGRIETEPKATLLDRLFYDLACKASIRSGSESPQEDLQNLIEEYFRRADQLKYCPHGRPIVFSLSHREVEKQFRRVK